jgi:flagellar motor switch protein FliN
MAQLTAEQVEQILEACRANLAAIGEAFGTGLDCQLRLTAGESKAYELDALAAFEGPGLTVSLVVGEQGILLLIPEPLPLPGWASQPNGEQNNRLQSFAHQLSQQVLPADLPAERSFATYSTNLKGFAEQTSVEATARLLELAASSADAGESDPPIASIAVIVPANFDMAAIDEAINAQMAAAAMDSEAPGEFPFGDDPSDDDSPDPDSPYPGSPDAVSPDTGLSLDQALRALRIMNVPVTVSVRLAERKMPLGQVVALVPGALVPFNKSCEELLDLFVNNYRFCQGEAIKIGENFGLKIARVAVSDERKEHVH